LSHFAGVNGIDYELHLLEDDVMGIKSIPYFSITDITHANFSGEVLCPC
jgi:hypothetical protein